MNKKERNSIFNKALKAFLNRPSFAYVTSILSLLFWIVVILYFIASAIFS